MLVMQVQLNRQDAQKNSATNEAASSLKITISEKPVPAKTVTKLLTYEEGVSITANDLCHYGSTSQTLGPNWNADMVKAFFNDVLTATGKLRPGGEQILLISTCVDQKNMAYDLWLIPGIGYTEDASHILGEISKNGEMRMPLMKHNAHQKIIEMTKKMNALLGKNSGNMCAWCEYISEGKLTATYRFFLEPDLHKIIENYKKELLGTTMMNDEASETKLSKNEVRETEDKYCLLVYSMLEMLKKKGITRIDNIDQLSKAWDEIAAFMAGNFGRKYGRAWGRYLLVDAIAEDELDCDTSCDFAMDILHKLGVNSEIIFFPEHAILRAEPPDGKSLFIETTATIKYHWWKEVIDEYKEIKGSYSYDDWKALWASK